MISKDDIVYISGAMTGLPGLNYPAFFAMEEILKEFGCSVLNPARHTGCFTYDDYMRASFSDIDRANVLVMLNGWRFSSGATSEYNYAVRRGKRIVFQRQVEYAIQEKMLMHIAAFSVMKISIRPRSVIIAAGNSEIERLLKTGTQIFVPDEAGDGLVELELKRGGNENDCN